MMDSKQHQELALEVLNIQKEVGDFQKRYFRNLPPEAVEEKAEKDLVTKIDIESEHLIREKLSQLTPGAEFFGEEMEKSSKRENLWIIDPIDGTTNFVHGLDQFCISIGYFDKSQIQIGCIYKPIGGDTFKAIRDHGLEYNGKPIPKSRSKSMEDSLIATGFPFRSRNLQVAFFKCADKVLEEARGIRRFGSAALDLAYVACGFFQGFWETDLQPYDVAAGILMIEESGCLYSQFSGENYRLFSDDSLVVGSESIFDRLQKITHSCYCQ